MSLPSISYLLAKCGLAQKSAADIGLGLAGIGLAGSSVAFAAYMITQNSGHPRINAQDRLAIFAQPVNQPYMGGSFSPFERKDGPQFDMMPVGTIRARSNGGDPAIAPPPEKIAGDYRIRGLSQGAALVQGPNGFISVRPGMSIAGLGDVIAIEARGRRMVIVTTGGLITEGD